jgi:hypothetical protein
MCTSIDICYLAILAKNLVVEYSTVANPDQRNGLDGCSGVFHLTLLAKQGAKP